MHRAGSRKGGLAKVQSVNALLAKMPPILLGIVKDEILKHEQCIIVAEGVPEESILEAVRETRPDVVVLPSSASLSPAELELLMCGGGARVRVVTLSPGHAGARRHELMPELVAMEDISPEGLGEAILSDLSPRWAVGRG